MLGILVLPPCAITTPGARWLAFSSSGTVALDLHVMREDGSCRSRLTDGMTDDLYASWSPARTLAHANASSGRIQIYLHDFTTGSDTLLDVGGLTATSPAFSPDGLLIAFEGYAPGVTTVSDIYVVPATGGTPVNLTGGTTFNAGPAWSPDGSEIYFASNRTGSYDVWKVPAAGGAATQVTTASGIRGRPAATPDGAGIAFTRPASGAAVTEVVIQALATGAIRVVTSQVDGEPAFDPTGARMVVTSFRSGSADLWLVDVATGAAVLQLTSDPAMDGAAAFAPFP